MRNRGTANLPCSKTSPGSRLSTLLNFRRTRTLTLYWRSVYFSMGMSLWMIHSDHQAIQIVAKFHFKRICSSFGVDNPTMKWVNKHSKECCHCLSDKCVCCQIATFDSAVWLYLNTAAHGVSETDYWRFELKSFTRVNLVTSTACSYWAGASST